MKYSYTFQVHPDETTVDPSSCLYELLSCMCTRCEVLKTEEEFNDFRKRLAARQFTLREIERVPYVEPENVL